MRLIVLPILATILILQGNVIASGGDVLSFAFKRSILLDISGPINGRAVELEDLDSPDNRHYFIKPEYSERYKIGKVVDGPLVIMDDRLWVLEREVFFLPYPDGTKYVEVFTTYKKVDVELQPEFVDEYHRQDVDDEFSRIEEFLKKPEDPCYNPIIRTPIELDLMNFNAHGLIEVEMTREGTKTFFVHNMNKLNYVIGTVRYGQYVVEERAEGARFRKVQLDETQEPIMVMIVQSSKDGTVIQRDYQFLGHEEGFKLSKEHMCM